MGLRQARGQVNIQLGLLGTGWGVGGGVQLNIITEEELGGRATGKPRLIVGDGESAEDGKTS